jgi:hypothetical protein
VAEHGLGSIGENLGHPPLLDRPRAVADRVNPTVKQMEPPALLTNLDGAAADSQRKQLPPRHHPVLSFGELGDGLVPGTRPASDTYIRANAALVAHAADGRASGRTRGARFVATPSSGTEKRPQPAVAASGFDPFK